MGFDRTGHRSTENMVRATEINCRTVAGCLQDIKFLAEGHMFCEHVTVAERLEIITTAADRALEVLNLVLVDVQRL